MLYPFPVFKLLPNIVTHMIQVSPSVFVCTQSVFNSLPAIQHVASHLNLKSLSFCNAKRFQTQLKCFVLKEMLLASNSHPKNATLKRGFVACS